jgi:Domain of unknown function (DUF4034)
MHIAGFGIFFRISVLWVSVMATCAGAVAKENVLLTDFLLKNTPELDELDSRSVIESYIVQLFQSGDFESLEFVAKHFRDQKLRTKSGLLKLNEFYFAFDKVLRLSPEEEQYRPDVEKLVNAWLEKYPSSSSAHLAYAQMLMQHGWSIRGIGFAGSVKPESWKPFFDYVEKARQYLQSHNSISDSDPRWDLLVLEIAKIQNVSDEEYVKLSNAALDRNPGFYQLYFAVVDRYLPKWGGNSDEVEKFANKAVGRTSGTEGHGLYARIYWAAAQGQFDDRLFNSSSVRWTEMKRGIDDVLKNYPDKWNIYNFGMFACFASDREKTNELLSRISSEKITPNWPYFENYEACRNYAGLK